AVRVLQVLLERGRPTPAERCPQTGDGGGVSYASLVLDLERAEGRVQLLHEVVLLVVEGRSSEAGDAHGAIERDLPPFALLAVLPRLPAGGDDPVGDHVHAPV